MADEPGALEVVGSNPTDPIMFVFFFSSLAILEHKRRL